MTAQCGAAIVLSFKDDASAYQVVAGLRTRSIKLDAEMVDVTNADSVGRFREILSGCGVRSASMSGDGIFQSDAGTEAVRDAYFANENRDAKILIPGFGTIEGQFKVTSLGLGGDFKEGVPVSLALESAGAFTFTGV